MPEYQNIQTRMLGANSFPYRNVTVNEAVFESAVEALNAFFFVGLQEAYFISVKMLLREFNLHKDIEVPAIRERHQAPSPEKLKLKGNLELMQRVRDNNSFDYRLYALGNNQYRIFVQCFTHKNHTSGVQRFCKMIMKYPDLVEELRTTTKVKCDGLR